MTGNRAVSERPSILVVDDIPENLMILDEILREDFRVRVALGAELGLELALGADPPDLILLDVMMPGMDGFEVCRRLKADPRTRGIPVVFVTALGEVEDEARGFEVGGVDYISKPVSAPIVLARVRTQLQLRRQNQELEIRVRERTRELRATRLEIIRRLGRAAEFKDNQTGLHVIRMSHYSRLVGAAAGLPREELEVLLNAAPMHDVGKIGIPDRVLQKSGQLGPEEWALMHRHPEMGAEIIGEHESDVLQMAREIALTHHERWDGTGYPRSLKGEEIPLVGRIVAIADVFDALTTDRPYKESWSVERAVAFIESQAGQHFDPDLVRSFHKALPGILKLRARYSDRGPAAAADAIPDDPVEALVQDPES
ncbi:MAG: HD domain-containing phosphohydrolase [Gemmatimonadota bacterium]